MLDHRGKEPSQLLHETISTARAVRAGSEVLAHLRDARLSLRTASSRLRIDVLGGTAYAYGERVDFSPSELAIVIALALNGGCVQRDVLADQLYGDAGLRNALNALKVTVHRVRRRVGCNDVIRHDQGRYALAPWVDNDVPTVDQLALVSTRRTLSGDDRSRLETIRERLTAARPGCMLMWPWFDETERRLNEMRRDVTAALARHALHEYRYDAALQLANEVLELDPLDESAIEIALNVLLDMGEKRQAEGYYRRYAVRLKAETGCLPSEDLERLVRSPRASPSAAR